MKGNAMNTSRKPKKDQKVYQMKVTLLGIRPLIWRRFRVLSDLTIEKLHQVLQTVMGWEDYHLYEFSMGIFRPGETIIARQTYGTGETVSVEMKLDELIYEEGQKLFYVYDFGDYWEHELLVEKIITPRKGVKGVVSPVCLAGKRACPPEDCGGWPGYMELQEIIKHPRSRAYREMREWLGVQFNPAAFDLKSINRDLSISGRGR
jgi:hypothetical protein